MFEAPPKTYEELMLWKVFTETTKDEVWQYIFRWVKRYGTPYIPIDNDIMESLEERELRMIYQEALTYVIKKK